MSYIGNPIVSTDFPVDYFSGNGSTTAFTLSVAPASVNSIDVQVSGVSQSPQTYTVSGTTLTFTAAPPTGSSNIVVRHLGIAGIPNTPSAASVTPAALSNPNAVYWDVNGNVGVGTTSPTAKFDVAGNIYMTAGDTFRMKNSASNASYIRAEQNSSGAAYTYATMDGRSTGFWAFSTNDTERMRIDSSGNLRLGINTGSVNSRMTIDGSAGCLALSGDDLNHYQLTLSSKSASSSTHYLMAFVKSTGSVVGNITHNDTSTTYATSSDYRLKENIAPMTGALEKVAQLKPVTYDWKSTKKASQGFIAHELQAVVPDCVTGEKDAVDAEGNPVYQGIDTSFLAATLTAAIQELKAELDATKAEVAALKGAA